MSEPPEPGESLPAFAGFQTHRRIGAGGSGAVYEATQLSLNRRVAVKVLLAHAFDDPHARARFVREAQVQASLSHPNLLALYDWHMEGEQAFLVTELLSGGTLRDRLSGGRRFDLPELAMLGSQIASAVACAHGAGIVHRDLKPENVLLTQAGHAKVADFGLARHVEGSAALTHAGTVMGTAGYMAPEVLLQSEPAASLDIYALGVILFEMAAGTKPFGRGTVAEIFYRQTNLEAPLVRTRRPELPEAFETIVRQCLEREPAARPSAAQVADRLTALARAEATGLHPSVRSGTRSGDGGTADSGRLAPTADRSTSAPGRGARRGAPDAGAPVPGAAPRAPKFVALAAAVLTFALACALGIALARRESREPMTPSALLTPPAPREFPRIAALAMGTGQARLELAGEAPPGSKIAWSRDGKGAPSEQQVATGARVIEVAGLASASRYRFQFTGGADSRVAFGRTLMQDRGGQAFWLDRRSAREVDVASEGRRLWFLWRTFRKPAQELLFAQSEDGGRTWSEPRLLFEAGGDGMKIPCLARIEGGLLAAWTSGVSPARTQLHHLADGAADWTDVGSFEGAAHHSLLVAREGGAELFTWRQSSGGVPELVRRQIRAPPVVVAPAQISLAWPHDEPIGRCVFVGVAEKSLVAFGRRSGKDDMVPGTNAILATHADAADTLRWQPRRPVTDPGEAPEDEPCLAATPAGVHLAYVEHDAVRVRFSSDGGRTFSSPRTAVPGAFGIKVKRVAMAASGRRLFIAVAYTEISYLVQTGVTLFSSADGLAWSFEGRQRMPLLSASSYLRLIPGPDHALLLLSDKSDGLILTRFTLKR